MTTIRANDLDLATLERLKARFVSDERSGESAGTLHVAHAGPSDADAASSNSPLSNPRETRADEFVIQLDARSLRVFLNALEERILADRSRRTDAEDHPRDRARRIRERLTGGAHSDSGESQHEDRQR